MNYKPLTKNRERNSNIELLRIVLMVMVILHHLIIKCKPYHWDKTVLFVMLNTFAIIAVNCFVFISGYYGIKFKIKTLLSFILQAIVYSAGTYIIYNILLSPENFSFPDLLKSFLPLTYEVWWFLNAFIGIYLLSPFINKGIDSLKGYQSAGIILILIYLSCSYSITGYNPYTGGGHGVFTMLLIYIIARYCGKYIKDIKKAFPLYIFIYLLTFALVITCIIFEKELLAWRLISYNSPLVILGAIFFFYSFKKIKLKSHIINKIAPMAFGVYLIHDIPYNRIIIAKFMEQVNKAIENPVLMGIALITIAIAIFLICACIEKIRQIICNPIIGTLDKKISPLVLKFKSITQ